LFLHLGEMAVLHQSIRFDALGALDELKKQGKIRWYANSNMTGTEIDAADAVIFGTPTYMGGASSRFRAFAEFTSKKWYGQEWKDKIAAGFTNSASQSGDKLATLASLQVFAAQHGMLWVGLDLLPGNNSSKGSVEDLNRLGSFVGLMTQANADQSAEMAPPDADHRTAEHFGRRVAEATRRWVRGKDASAKAA